MLCKKKQARIAATLMVGIALIMSGGVSLAKEENLIADKAFAVTQPEMMGVTQPEMMGVSELESLEVSQPKSLESGRFPKGKYIPTERENVEYNRCASRKGFSEQLNCARESLGTTQK